MRILFVAAAILCVSACTFYEECPAGQAVHKGEQKCRPLRCGAGQAVVPASPHRCSDIDIDVDSGRPQEDGGSENDAGDAACTEPQQWFADTDGDGLGDPNQVIEDCIQPDGYVENFDDHYPHCGRDVPPADCEPGAIACSVATAGGRDTCIEDPAFPGCMDWTPDAACEATAPVCSGAGACGGCLLDKHCSHLSRVCGETGACVECTPDTEFGQCPDVDPSPGDQGPACDPVAKTCTGKPRGTVSGCGACLSDSECEAGSRCVSTMFEASRHGSYCLQIAPTDGCPRGAPSRKTAVSTLGVEGDYCFPREVLTTCEAVLDFGDVCTSDGDCGARGISDGLCLGPVGAKTCTYACSGERDCTGSTCTGPVGAKYCNPN